MEMKNLLFTLSGKTGIGNITDAQNAAYEVLSKYAKAEITDNYNVIGFLSGNSDYTVMLDAHIDQIGFIVTDIDDNGFLTVSNSGGIDISSLPSRAVTVHGKKNITAVFCSIPPHLANGYTEFSDITEIKLDTALGEKAKDFVSLGDYVTFENNCFALSNNYVCGPSFDNRASVACLLEVAKRLCQKELPVNVVFCLSTGEELGLRGIRTAAFSVNPDEAIAVDVTFGDGPTISTEESCALGDGGMIGISPVLDKKVSQKLINVAKENNIPYGLEVMGSKTGTNADMLGISRGGVKTCTLSIPLRNMHTAIEIVNLDDLSAVCDILENYILSGGVLND